MDSGMGDIVPLRRDIQSREDWFCGVKSCLNNRPGGAKCDRCQREKCAECQGPMDGISRSGTMWTCCNCGDGPHLYTHVVQCVMCHHTACANCTSYK
ncbi:hypothetical protein BDW59DRAFT_94925 [Aspergillus cavernicola]|uniref:RanBP2-type domain-containing protein n=1 Tax=Aspergillus cavernicola TaxID=176166 RepID=A0ABR4IZM1_9EURO